MVLLYFTPTHATYAVNLPKYMRDTVGGNVLALCVALAWQPLVRIKALVIYGCARTGGLKFSQSAMNWM